MDETCETLSARNKQELQAKRQEYSLVVPIAFWHFYFYVQGWLILNSLLYGGSWDVLPSTHLVYDESD